MGQDDDTFMHYVYMKYPKKPNIHGIQFSMIYKYIYVNIPIVYRISDL